MDDDSERDRPVQIEITPAMIEAGAFVLCEFDPERDRVSEIAAEMFSAMVRVA